MADNDPKQPKSDPWSNPKPAAQPGTQVEVNTPPKKEEPKQPAQPGTQVDVNTPDNSGGTR